jgi:hypothetical protein
MLGVDPDSGQVLGLGDFEAFLRTSREGARKARIGGGHWRGTPGNMRPRLVVRPPREWSGCMGLTGGGQF